MDYMSARAVNFDGEVICKTTHVPIWYCCEISPICLWRLLFNWRYINTRIHSFIHSNKSVSCLKQEMV